MSPPMTSSYGEIVERLEKLTGGDQVADNEIFWATSEWENLGGYWRRHKVTGKQERYGHLDIPRYTASIDAAVALVEKMLPGWGWRVATCCVSDDAWVFPDFNSPEHGERLRREFREDIDWVALTDVDLRPPGRPAIALVISMFRALTVNENG